MLSTRKTILAVLVLLLLAAVTAAGVTWHIENRVGRFSFINYQRISDGMELSEVESLLGAVGEEIGSNQMPGHPPYVKRPGAPDGWTGVVWGDHFYRWKSGDDNDDIVFIGIKNGRVVSKYYRALSL